jgi:2-polyprenyl-3-methyl-5-hydroxy-6-metoxy-1,4-benzoquinol methylase
MQNTYEQYAVEYARLVAEEERSAFSPSRDMLIPVMLGFIGSLQGVHVVDAGCGEGRLSRILAAGGARVLGIDASPTLIELAKQRSRGMGIDFKVADLEKPIADIERTFALIVSHLVIDDVADHIGFIRTMAMLCPLNGRVILSKNNPYSGVLRDKVKDYFDSGTSVLYQGLSSKGVKVHYYHRTMEDYAAAFRRAGFVLSRLSDVEPPRAEAQGAGDGREMANRFRHFPFFMVLEFTRIAEAIGD